METISKQNKMEKAVCLYCGAEICLELQEQDIINEAMQKRNTGKRFMGVQCPKCKYITTIIDE